MAIGLMRAAAAQGVRVPEELSVAGFDDIFSSELITPSLTTVRAQLVEAGERAVANLLARLAGEEEDDLQQPLQTTLVVRDSTGAASTV
jgi:LacI family transcriptional regulator